MNLNRSVVSSWPQTFFSDVIFLLRQELPVSARCSICLISSDSAAYLDRIRFLFPSLVQKPTSDVDTSGSECCGGEVAIKSRCLLKAIMGDPGRLYRETSH